MVTACIRTARRRDHGCVTGALSTHRPGEGSCVRNRFTVPRRHAHRASRRPARRARARPPAPGRRARRGRPHRPHPAERGRLRFPPAPRATPATASSSPSFPGSNAAAAGAPARCAVGLAVLGLDPLSLVLGNPQVTVDTFVVHREHRRRGAGAAAPGRRGRPTREETGAAHVVAAVGGHEAERQRFFARMGFAPLTTRRIVAVDSLTRSLGGVAAQRAAQSRARGGAGRRRPRAAGRSGRRRWPRPDQA